MDDTARPQSDIDKTNGEETINLADYLRVISKHRRMIFWFCAITIIVTTVISMFLPKMYAATASVMPPVDTLQRESMFASGLGALKSPLMRQAMDVSSIGDMYAGILHSRSVADAIIERFNLGEVYHRSKYASDVRKKLAERTSVKVEDDGIVTIRVEDRDPCRAADMANAYVEELDKQNKRLFVGQAHSKKVFFENRLREIEQDLSKVDSLLSRDAKIKEMLFELLTKEYEIAKIEVAKSIPTIQVLDTAVVPEKKSKPKRTQMVLFAGITGLFVSVFAAFVRERLTRASFGGA
jgi:tyrosine-protein kinase Etk/Wzc